MTEIFDIKSGEKIKPKPVEKRVDGSSETSLNEKQREMLEKIGKTKLSFFNGIEESVNYKDYYEKFKNNTLKELKIFLETTEYEKFRSSPSLTLALIHALNEKGIKLKS